MTKEQIAYADMLNLIGTVVLDPAKEAVLVDVLGVGARNAAHSKGPHADCPSCYWTTPVLGWDDGEHFADLWEHLLTAHKLAFETADVIADRVWGRQATASGTVGAA